MLRLEPYQLISTAISILYLERKQSYKDCLCIVNYVFYSLSQRTGNLENLQSIVASIEATISYKCSNSKHKRCQICTSCTRHWNIKKSFFIWKQRFIVIYHSQAPCPIGWDKKRWAEFDTITSCCYPCGYLQKQENMAFKIHWT